MASLTIRGLDPATHAQLRVAAAQHGRSMEAEVRAILHERFPATPPSRGLGTRIHERVAALGGAELELPGRTEAPRAPEFDG
jgi:antitoxin FitA